ncbi:MAG: ABC transporter substrate-binding protein [Chloroflexota bacterium]
MSGPAKREMTRRSILAGGALLLVPAIAGCMTAATPSATPPATVKPLAAATEPPATGQPAPKGIDFRTGADIARAEAEGGLVYYGHDGDAGIVALLDGFKRDFPRIKTTYVRTQPGALYAKLVSERTVKAFQCDILQMSDIASALDFQRSGGYQPYVSPEAGAYKPEYLSKPAGSYFWAGVTLAGIAFNTTQVKSADAPRSWRDLLDSKWTDAISVNLASSGSQFVNWYALRGVFGKDFWMNFGGQKPKAFASNGQLYDRLSKGYDAVCGLAEHAGFIAAKEKGAAIDFVAPAEGVTLLPSVQGIVTYAPHPETAKLFLDWCMSARGQAIYQSDKNLYYGSVRAGAPPLPTGKRLSDLNLLYPSDWEDLVASQQAFVAEWNAIIGM